ncbi:DUF2141 domain-containing protein [Occallatibacter riparius]|uniref:DUF2141 domain-containing protein n=1 Tax=Occallatibacter riparius TaxID=1002689 RepID=A0A9J7BQQ8_9BACT|nr:DUF2141 domain-containing protein [Occallatibacter riparius]UWZ83429.1 DUF2141 domain-containing protein [Occallatibacter riparius]
MNTRAQFALVSALAFISGGPRPSVPNPVASLLTTGWETTEPAQPLPAPPDNSPQSCTLRIHVDGFRNTRGNLGTIIFRSPDGWPEDKDKSFRHGPAPIDKATSTAVAVWPDLPPGDYGVAAIDDENSNAKLDRNLIGIPKEGFGFANNPHVGLVPPSFDKALVHVTCPATEVTIHLQYK